MIWFDNASNEIKVCTSAPENGKPTWESYGGSVEIEIADGTQEKNFLNMEDDGLAVREMETSVTKTTSDIVVAGGPLANNVNEDSDSWPSDWKDASGNKKIPAGTSVQALLEKLFNQELFPNEATKPSISITGATSLGLKEVGSTVTIPALSMSTSNGKFNASYSTPGQPTVTGVTWSNKSMTVGTPTGFTNMSTTGGTTSVAATSGKIVEGANSVTYNASASYSAPTNSPVTNLGKPAKDAAYTFTAGTANAAAVSTTATGVYPIYTNGVQLDSTNTNKDGAFFTKKEGEQEDKTKLALIDYTQTNGGITYIGFGSPSLETWIVYLPTSAVISSADGFNPTSGEFEIEYKFAHTENDTITITTAAGATSYNCWKCTTATAANNVKFNIKKQ
jgi:hypothetical protein